MKTLTIYGTTNDGYIYGSSTDYTAARGTAGVLYSARDYCTIGQRLTSFGVYYIYRSFLKFSTSDIPDTAIINSAQLKMVTSNYNASSAFNIEVVKQDWSAYDPLNTTDMDDTYDGCLAGTKDVNWHIFGAGTTSISPETYYSAYLDTSYISTTDCTYYSLRSSNDAGGIQPTTSIETAAIYLAESTDISYRPALVVDYTATSTNNTYILNVDWDNDGTPEDDVADYMTRWACDKGRSRLIGRPGSGFEPYRVGRLSIELDNSTGRFNPWNTGGSLYGNLAPGKKMTFQAIPASSTSVYSVFTGYTSNLIQHGWNKTATLTCEDGMGILKRLEGYSNANINEDNATTDNPEGIWNVSSVINRLLTNIVYPYGTDVSTGDPTSDCYMLSPILLKDNSLSLLEDIANSAIGTIAAEGDGTFAYHSIFEDDAAIATLTDGVLLNKPSFANPWDQKRDSVSISGKKNLIGLTYPLSFVTTDTPITIGIGENKSLSFPYSTTTISSTSTYSFHNRWYGGIAASTNYPVLLNSTSATITGTETTDVEYSATYYPSQADFVFTNNDSQVRYINKLKTASIGDQLMFAYKNETFLFGSTSPDWNSNEFSMTNPYYNVNYWDGVYGQVYESTPTSDSPTTNYTATQIARIDTIGNLLYDYVSATDHAFPVLQIEGRPATQFLMDVEKKVTYSSALLNSTDDYRICGLSHKSLGTPQAVRTTLYLYPVIPSTT